MTIVLTNVHMDLVDKPTYELMGIMMIVVVELPFSSTDSSYEPLMI